MTVTIEGWDERKKGSLQILINEGYIVRIATMKGTILSNASYYKKIIEFAKVLIMTRVNALKELIRMLPTIGSACECNVGWNERIMQLQQWGYERPNNQNWYVNFGNTIRDQEAMGGRMEDMVGETMGVKGGRIIMDVAMVIINKAIIKI